MLTRDTLVLGSGVPRCGSKILQEKTISVLIQCARRLEPNTGVFQINSHYDRLDAFPAFQQEINEMMLEGIPKLKGAGVRLNYAKRVCGRVAVGTLQWKRAEKLIKINDASLITRGLNLPAHAIAEAASIVTNLFKTSSRITQRILAFQRAKILTIRAASLRNITPDRTPSVIRAQSTSHLRT